MLFLTGKGKRKTTLSFSQPDMLEKRIAEKRH